METVEFRYGILCDPLEQQAKEQGYTLGEEAPILEKERGALNLLRIRGILTDSMADKCYQKFNKQVIGELKRKVENE